MKLALFDFDHTISYKDSLLDFTLYAVGFKRFLKGIFILSPVLILFKLKILNNDTAKQYFIRHFFKGLEFDEFTKIATQYSQEKLPKIIRDSYVAKLNWHKSKGHRVVVVSASIDCWLKGNS